MKSLLFSAIFAFAIAAFQPAAFADDSGSSGTKRFNITMLNKRAEQRSLKRFTLKEWMEGNEKRKMMDMWLSLNSPSPYEFSVAGSLNQYTLDGSSNNQVSKKSYEGSFSAYATAVGLTGEYQNNTEENYNDTTALFNLRVFGTNLQDTSFTLHYGLRTRTENSGLYRLNQQFAAATLQVYLIGFFGVQSQYRYYMPITESYYGDIKPNDLTIGAFIDFDAFRIFGDYYHEKQNSQLNGTESTIDRTGTKIGLKIFF
ncbi:MAG: hypothetical protein H7256_08960 [Bdellovibrio sp.]|nr:hypothetical protein [Bdellovibrio sp.]